MTDREKAIVMAHTGICMLEGEKIDVFYQYLYELYNRPVYTHELIILDIKEQSKSDFLRLCKEEEPTEIIRCKDCKWFGDIGCAIRIVDDSDRPSENDFCSFAERKDKEAIK